MEDKKLEKLWIQYGFPNIGKFTQILKNKNYEYSYNTIKEFLNKQETYQRHKGKRVKSYGHITASSPDELWQCDLIDYQKYGGENKEYKWVLLCIDVFTRKGFGEKIKNKTTASTTQALNKIFLRTSRKPKVFMSDNGKEFVGRDMQGYMKKKGIMHITNQVHDHKALGIIDRFVRTIKTMIAKQFTYFGDHNWIKYLPSVIDFYNKTPHKGLNGIAPNEAEKYRAVVQQLNVNKNMKMNRIKNIYKVGDRVRTRINKDKKFGKGYEPVWSPDVYKITKAIGKSYILDDGTDKKYRQYNLWKIPAEEI